MLKTICVSVAALLVVGCAAHHAPRVSCSGRLEEINPPQLMSVPRAVDSSTKAPTP